MQITILMTWRMTWRHIACSGRLAACNKQENWSCNLPRRTGDVDCIHSYMTLAQKQGNYEEAHRLLQKSLSIDEQLEDLSGQAISLHQLGGLLQVQGNYGEAHRLLQKSLSIKEQLGDLSGQANSLIQLGSLAQLQ